MNIPAILSPLESLATPRTAQHRLAQLYPHNHRPAALRARAALGPRRWPARLPPAFFPRLAGCGHIDRFEHEHGFGAQRRRVSLVAGRDYHLARQNQLLPRQYSISWRWPAVFSTTRM
jgi:hypothetical protein